MDIEITINNAYLPYLNDDTRNQIFFGGSSSGKSVFLSQRSVLDVLGGDRNYLICRNVQKTIRKSVFNEISKVIYENDLKPLFDINKSDLVITCIPTNKQILFAGLDDVEKIKSITPVEGVITDIWVEEATETNYQAVRQLAKRLRGKSKVKKRLTMSFNPILQSHWIYTEYFGGWDENKTIYHDDGLLIMHTTYKDNDFLEPDDIYELENEKDPYYYDVYTLGKWGVLGGVIFKNWRVEDLSEIKKTFDKLKNGLDFGFSDDPSAMPCTHYDRKRKRIYIYDELYERGLTNDILADEVKKKIDNQYVTCDSAEPKSIQELRNMGVNAYGAKKGKDSVNFGIDWLQRQEIVIDVSCQNMKNEIQMYKWKEDKDGNIMKVPVDRDNHLIDALRYAYESEMKQDKWGF